MIIVVEADFSGFCSTCVYCTLYSIDHLLSLGGVKCKSRQLSQFVSMYLNFRYGLETIFKTP